MIRRKAEQTLEYKTAFGGPGTAEMRKILNSDEELYSKGRLFNHAVLQPGCAIGEHTHHGDNEIYYILSGTGTYNDNGTYVRVFPGDTMICNDGEMHGIVNDGDEVLEFIALILYS